LQGVGIVGVVEEQTNLGTNSGWDLGLRFGNEYLLGHESWDSGNFEFLGLNT